MGISGPNLSLENRIRECIGIMGMITTILLALILSLTCKFSYEPRTAALFSYVIWNPKPVVLVNAVFSSTKKNPII